jgi:hypothetical protein
VSLETPHIILCSGLKVPVKYKKHPPSHILRLSLDGDKPSQNIKVGLPYFVQKLNCHFPDRVKDLLEIAGYIYAADRLVKRGNPGQLEYHNWSRHFLFHFHVRDQAFWKKPEIQRRLNELLCFVSGDRKYEFKFYAGAKDVGQTSMFDDEEIEFEEKNNSSVALFSGGLDSLAGALSILENTTKKLLVVSHLSNNFGVKAMQKDVFALLKKDYGDRVQRFPFECNLTGDRAAEETQRTRVFLYACIAYSLAIHTVDGEINIFENGVTSANFSKRQDLINARASRTTHPKTLHLLQEFFGVLSSKNVVIHHPFIYKTKADIFNIIKQYGKEGYINSTLSCTKTFLKFKNNSQATHCGICSQCIDRRFSAFASGLQDYDATYDCDVSKDCITDLEGKSHLNSFLRFNLEMRGYSDLGFYTTHMEALSDMIEYLPGNSKSLRADSIFQLLKRNAAHCIKALQIMRSQESIDQPKLRDTLFAIIDDRVYLRTPVDEFTDRVCERLLIIIPQAFHSSKPGHENSLNDTIQAHLNDGRNDYEREFPTVRFSFGTAIPDHSYSGINLFIEAKLVRKTTPKSKITDEIAADIVKYPSEVVKLFVIYDPESKIPSPSAFIKDFQKNPLARIQIVK